MRQVVATIDGRLRQAGDRYTLSNQTPRPAAGASAMGHKRNTGSEIVESGGTANGTIVSACVETVSTGGADDGAPISGGAMISGFTYPTNEFATPY